MQAPSKVSRNNSLQGFLRTLRVAEALEISDLSLFMLRGVERPTFDYIMAREAIESKTLALAEATPGGRVGEILATNSGGRMVLLLSGEELVGARQNRVLNTSILLRPSSRTIIPVSCVEGGRWQRASQHFSSGSVSPSSIRKRITQSVGESLRRGRGARSDQLSVWAAVTEELTKHGTVSATGAMADIPRRWAGKLTTYRDVQCPENALGAIAVANGTFIAMDLFDQPAPFRSAWDRLLEGYALDSLARSQAKHRRFTARAAEVLIEHLGEVECQRYPSVGVGEDWHFEAADLVGHALVADNVSVHLCAFPNRDYPGP